MEKLMKLTGCDPKIHLVDATMRDGGLVNNFNFTDDFVRALYETNLKAGVDYMEFGYKAPQRLFDSAEFGKWKYCRDEDIRAIVGANNTNMKVSVMADVGRCDYERDIISCSDSPIDLVRVATYINTIPEAARMVEDAAGKGYETTCNLMAVSCAEPTEVRAALDILGKTPVKAVYVVDSYGALHPHQISAYMDIFTEAGAKYGKEVGIHGHNNQQLAFANTISAIEKGASWVDATYSAMGRGAGNCAMELLLGYLKDSRYDAEPVLEFVGSYMENLKAEGVRWGYEPAYLITGILNHHPGAAIQFVEEGRKDYGNFYRELFEKK